MSKFYTYDELQANFPTVDAVAQTRDRVNEFLCEREFQNRVVVFGSSLWGTHSQFDDQHSRRSDVDVAISNAGQNHWGKFYGGYDVTEFCEALSNETHVPIEVVYASHSDDYDGYGALINPSTADHFSLLAQKFKGPYRKFRSSMKVNDRGRIEDLERYIKLAIAIYTETTDKLSWFEDVKNLAVLSKLENVPDHIIRKVLGREKLLPCPDSKKNVREAFFALPYQWVVRDDLRDFFETGFSLSGEYESLLDDVKIGLSRPAYNERMHMLATRIANNAWDILRNIPNGYSEMCDFLAITRIPKGTPVVVLHHHPDGSGWIDVERLNDDFGNPDNGVEWLGYIRYPIYGEPGDRRLIKGWRKSEEKILYCGQRKLLWIKDPKDPRGWFTYRNRDGAYSIKPTDEAFLEQFERETDYDTVPPRRAITAMRRYYKRFSRDALNPAYSHVSIVRERKLSAA